MTWQVWIFLALCLAAAVAYAVVRIARDRRRAALVDDGAAAASASDRAAAAAEARTEVRRAEDEAADDRSTARARDLVSTVQAQPPVPEQDGDGQRAGRRPRSKFADELGLDR